MSGRLRVFAGAALALCVLCTPAIAQHLPLSVAAQTSGATTTYSVPVQTLLAFGALSFLPAILLLMTSFTRLIIVLSLVRQALGLQSTPPNQVLVGMALFLTFSSWAPRSKKYTRTPTNPTVSKSWVSKTP